jgi:hypothetical protein
MGSIDWTPKGYIKVWDDVAGTSYVQTGTQRVFSHWDYSNCYQGANGAEGNTETAAPGGGSDCAVAVYVDEPVYGFVDGSYVPLVDVEVRARNWFTTHIGKTNTSGYYICDGDFGPYTQAQYEIKWEKYHFSIRAGTYGQAVYTGPNRKGDWNANIGTQGSTTVTNSQQYYALIFQAARDYFYGTRFGLASPPRNKTFGP